MTIFLIVVIQPEFIWPRPPYSELQPVTLSE